MAGYMTKVAGVDFGPLGGAYYPPNFQFEVVRSFEDGNRLFMHIAQNPDGHERWVTMSLLQICDDGSGRMLHQISNRVAVRVNPDHTMVSGARDLDPNEDAATNKRIVRDFMQCCLVEGDISRFFDFVDEENFVPHNPHMHGRASGFRDLAAQEVRREDGAKYVNFHEVVGSCDFVAVFSDMQYRGQPIAAADLFRLRNGKIVEHWDIAGEHRMNRTAGNDVGRGVGG